MRKLSFDVTYWPRFINDTQGEKAPSNKTLVLTKSTNMGIWAVDTTNQLFIRGSWTEIKFSKKQSSY